MRNSIFRYIVLLVLFGQTAFGLAQTTYSINAEKSELRFEVSHMGFLTVEGTFKEFSGKIVYGTKLETLEINVKSNSIFTHNQSRDTSLKEPSYLDTKKYPLIQFTTLKTYGFEDERTITGFLTIKNSRRRVQVPYSCIANKEKGAVLLTARTSIYRTDFGLEFGPMDQLVGNEIKLEIMLVAFLTNK